MVSQPTVIVLGSSPPARGAHFLTCYVTATHPGIHLLCSRTGPNRRPEGRFPDSAEPLRQILITHRPVHPDGDSQQLRMVEIVGEPFLPPPAPSLDAGAPRLGQRSPGVSRLPMFCLSCRGTNLRHSTTPGVAPGCPSSRSRVRVAYSEQSWHQREDADRLVRGTSPCRRNGLPRPLARRSGHDGASAHGSDAECR